VPDEGGELEGGLEEHEVYDGEQQARAVEPEQLVSRLQHHAHTVMDGRAAHAAALQHQRRDHVLQLRPDHKHHLLKPVMKYKCYFTGHLNINPPIILICTKLSK